MSEELTYPIKIIYAEDSPVDIDLTKQVFEKLKDKFSFTFVMTGKELLNKVKEESFDIILLDNHLPDIEGVNLIPKLMDLKITYPIVIITGLGDEDLVLKALKFGASDYISKSGDYIQKLPEYLERVYVVHKKLKQTKFHIRIEELQVLYVEHDEHDIELLERYLKRETPHIKLTAVRNSFDALRLIEERDFDLILIDLRMPEIDGLELVRRIRHKKSDLPTIIITGKGDEQSAIEALKLGVYDYVSKDLNYIEKLPRIIETSYLKFKYDKSLLNHERKYLELNVTLEQQFQEKTISLVKEIEKRKESEKKYYDLYRTLETFLQTIGDLVVVKDKDLRLVYINKACEKFLGLSLKQIQESKINRAFQLFIDNNIAFDKEIKSTLREIKGLLELEDNQGNIHYFEVIKTPLLDSSNNFDGIIGIYRDLTDRVILENKIRRSEERYRSFVENSSELLVCFELEEPIEINLPVQEQISLIYKNAKLAECNIAFAESHGFNSPDEISSYPLGYFLPIISEVNRELFKNFIENNYVIKNFESKELKKDGSIVYFLISLNGIVVNGKLLRIWKVKKDITEIKKLNLELEERVNERTKELQMLNQELESFNSAVSHDLKAPLRAIVGFGELLVRESGETLNKEMLDYLNEIVKNGKKLQGMLDDLLRLSKVSLLGLKKETFALGNLIVEILDELKSIYEIEKVKFKINELPELLADRNLVKIAFSNLISNAIKFSLKQESPEVEIGTIPDEKNFVIYIKDNGAGFNSKYKEKLFIPFQRLHSEAEFPGTGIGLAIVKRIIDRHNGKIWAKSELNKGAIFYVSFPKN